jgi:hypothetical protein
MAKLRIVTDPLPSTLKLAKRVHVNGGMRYRLVSPSGGVLFVKVLARSGGYLVLREDRRGRRG